MFSGNTTVNFTAYMAACIFNEDNILSFNLLYTMKIIGIIIEPNPIAILEDIGDARDIIFKVQTD